MKLRNVLQWYILYSPTCKLHNINPYYWLKDVLENMHRFTTANIEGLLPKNWKNYQSFMGCSVAYFEGAGATSSNSAGHQMVVRRLKK